jgi:hypothetical protein
VPWRLVLLVVVALLPGPPFGGLLGPEPIPIERRAEQG